MEYLKIQKTEVEKTSGKTIENKTRPIRLLMHMPFDINDFSLP
jgi:hypothetical protein